MSKIALIGAGRMGGAMLRGWIKGGVAASDIIIVDPNPSEDAQAAIKAGALCVANLTTDNSAALQTVILAIKPQMFAQLAPKIGSVLPPECRVISILAGTTQGNLARAFGKRPIIRAMPNTPAAIGQGITGFFANSYCEDLDCEAAKTLLSAGGEVIEVSDESLIDVVTAVSGSGPAYVFYLCEALEAAAINAGMPEDLAAKLARQTVVGSGALLAESTEASGQLRRAVTSPGGTTEAALEVLMAEDGIARLMRRAVSAAVKRSKDLAE